MVTLLDRYGRQRSFAKVGIISGSTDPTLLISGNICY
jgi:hypothetical protein